MDNFLKYPKINSVWKRDLSVKDKNFIIGDYSSLYFEALTDIEWVGTEKIHGTNIRILINSENGSSIICGRTEKSVLPHGVVEWFEGWRKNASNTHVYQHHNLALFGEGYGAKIQGCGHLYRDDISFILFDVALVNYENSFVRWLDRGEVFDIASNYNLDVVPFIKRGTLAELEEFVKSGFSSLVADEKLQAEGLVCTPSIPLLDKYGNRIIVKLKTKDY